MARFMVKASEFKNVCKAVNDRKLAELKKEIIEILKKQDEKDVKKAIDYFNSQELHYTHLEKSLISGKWIQKAGYGVGTVRIWKGKKYKKIAPGKWARVFDKEGRGTNIAIGKLIAKVQKIDNVEDLMAFVMQNKQRFVDENGIDLPVLDKLRAAVDAKNNGGMGSKTTSKPAEKTDGKYDKELVDSWKDDYKDFSTDALKEKIEEYTKVLERAKNDNPSPDQRVAVKQNEHRLKALNELLEEKKNKPAEKNEDNSRYVEMAKDKIEKYAGKKINSNEISDIKILDDGERSGFLTFEFKSGNDKYKMTYDSGFGGEKGGVSIKKIESEESEAEKTQNRSEAMKGNQNAKKYNDKDEAYKDLIKLNKEKGEILDQLKKLNEQLQVAKTKKYYAEMAPKEGEDISEYDKQIADIDNEMTMLEARKYDIQKQGEDIVKQIDQLPDKTPKTKSTKIPPADMDRKQPIAKSTKIADGKCSIPNTPEIKSQMKQLLKYREDNTVPGTYRDSLTEVYYDGENIVATNGKVMKVIKTGELEGIEPNNYVKIDISGKDNINISQLDKKERFPNYKGVIPYNHTQKFSLDTKKTRELLESMQRDGSFGDDKSIERVTLDFIGDEIKIDGKTVGKANNVIFNGDRARINLKPQYLLNALTGEETVITCGEDNSKSIAVITDNSTDVLMPMDGLGEAPNYAENRRLHNQAETEKAERKAQKDQEEAERATRKMTGEGKSEIIKNRPEGVEEDDYSSMIDFADDYYTKLGYDNTSARGMQQIKDMVDRAINRINAKDYEFLDSLENTDNKVSRKIFEMLTGEKVGTNRASAQKAWENWVGEEGVKAHKDKIAAAEKAEKDRVAAEKKAADDADREQYHGFLDGKTAAGKGKAKQILAKRARFDNKVYSYQELVDHYINELGGRVSSSVHTTSGGKDKTYYGVYDKEGRGFEIPKIVFDYGKHIQGDKGVEKSFIKDFIFLNEYEHDLLDEEDLEGEEPSFNDYSAEQPELFNSTEMKVQEAFNRCGCCL